MKTQQAEHSTGPGAVQTPAPLPAQLVAGSFLGHVLSAALLCTLAVSAAQAQSSPRLLSGLNGSNGFKIDGALADDQLGDAVSNAGDVNGDGLDDLLVGAPGADPNGSLSGSSYVLFGQSGGFASPLSVSTLTGNSGFQLNGEAMFDISGSSLAGAGDVNGDGLDDFLIGAFSAQPNGANSGRAYLVFGTTTGFPSPLALSALNGSNGVQIDGEAAGDGAGESISSAGDINGDGFADVLIRAANGGQSGRAYVVFGQSAGFLSPLALGSLNGQNGFRLDSTEGDGQVSSVSGLGDVNGDGVDDLIVGTLRTAAGLPAAQRSYVLFGNRNGFDAAIALSALGGTVGFRIDGEAVGSPTVSAAGDVNGDGLNDLLVGEPSAAGNSGSAYVVYGRSSGFSSPLLLSSLSSTEGFRLDGELANDRAGVALAGAGDLNGDGMDDLLIGTGRADPNFGVIGISYVVYGRSSFPATLALASLDGINGYALTGEVARDFMGASVSGAGDLNGDGLDDLVVGASRSDMSANNAGRSYVVFGARDRIFRDGNENTNLDQVYPRLAVRAGFIGSAVRWSNGATCNCDDAPFDFNIYRSGADMAFFWPSGGVNAGVVSGSTYEVLQPGAVIGANSTFSADATVAATANWRAGTTGYLGFRWANLNSGFIAYGYAKIQTTGPNGYPVKILRYGINLTGLSVTIPPE